jgi:hypothetical protein
VTSTRIPYSRAMRYVLLLLAACSGDDGGGTPDAPKATKSGYVQIQSYDAMNVPNMPTRGGTTSAGFFVSGAFCTNTMHIGPCDLASCVSTPPPSVSAGTIMITGAAQAITMLPKANQTYDTFMTADPLFSGGESITFAAAGADVPAFTKSIVAPAKATITSPAKPSSTSPLLVINRSQDFTVSWTGGGSGLVQVALNSAQADQRLFCRFEASAGTGKVPTAALSMLQAENGGFAMASIAQTVHEAGDYAVDVSAYFNAVWPDNAIVSGAAMFQ